MSVESGGTAQVTSDDFTVSSNTETADEMRENLASEPKPLDGEEEDPKEAAARERKEAAAKLGKAGGEAAAKAREKADKAKPGKEAAASETKPEPEAKPEEGKGKEPAAEEDKPGHPRHDAQARIQELARLRADERRRNDELAARLERLEQDRERLARGEPITPREQSQPQEAPGKPKSEDYDDWHEYVAALVDWTADQKLKAHQEQAQRQERAQAHARGVVQRLDAFYGRLRQAGEADPQVLERSIDPRLTEMQPSFMVEPGKPLGPENCLKDEILASERPAEMMIYLSEHPDEVVKLLKSPDARSLTRAFAALESQLSGTSAAPEPRPKAQEVSKAPPPVRPVQASAHVGEDLDDDTDLDTWIAVQNARERKGR